MMPCLKHVRARSEDGAALLTTIFLMAILTAMASTVTVMTVNNVGNAGRDRQGTSALALSEGGIAQAVSHLRSPQALRRLACAPDCKAANPWGEKPDRLDNNDGFPAHTVTVVSGETYEVWIEPLQPLDVASFTPGVYRVTSTGTSAGNPGNRTVQVDVEISPFKYPLAVVADTVEPGGSGAVWAESVFSSGCVFKRDKIKFNGSIDAVYGVPAAVHSAQYITESQGSGNSCGPTDTKNIHHPSNSTNGCSNDVEYHYDQDRQGKNPVGSPCYAKFPASGSEPAYPLSSLVTSTEELEDKWNFQMEGLTASQLEILKAAAIEQGFYFTDTTAIPTVLRDATTSAPYPQPILFYDLQGSAVGGTVNLNDFGSAYARSWPLTAGSASCTGRAAFIVVRNGDVSMNANTTLSASVFVLGPSPYGKVNKLNGGAQLIGTVYARTLDMTGTGDIRLDDCFVQNPPGQALEVRVTKFVEVDR